MLILLFSAFYFADVLIRASEKRFWYDELFTVYICRLPSFASIWQGLLHGIDFNPPLIFVLTSLSQRFFGEGPIGTRLPEIIGFWVFSVCLFYFLRRRFGVWPGFVAMILPSFTGVFYYAYEARPHALVLAFCGLALLSWQMWSESPEKTSPLVAFSASFLLALFSHCYALLLAIPFAASEAAHLVQFKIFRARLWAALLVPEVIACSLYVPLLRAFKYVVPVPYPFAPWLPTLYRVPEFYNWILAPVVLLVILTLVLLAAGGSNRAATSLPFEFWCLVLGFLSIPIFGLGLAYGIKAPYFFRYFLSALVGVSVLFGVASARLKPQAQIILVVAVSLFGARSFEVLIKHRVRGIDEVLHEPSSGLELDTNPRDVLATNPLLKSTVDSPLPVAMRDALTYFYLLYYEPKLAPRLYYVTRDSYDFFGFAFEHIRPWWPEKFNPVHSYRDLLRSNAELLVYADSGSAPDLSWLSSQGVRVSSVQWSDGRFLARLGVESHGGSE